MTDLTYTQDGMFTRFIPETAAGEIVWRQMHEQMGGCTAVLNFEAKRVISQIRAAGYSVKKAAKPAKITKSEIDNLYAELVG